eukprot:TRINITY_DN25857_c0_g1_i2.p1 TRINITY_DN25857_c0_g1~~TRINITY_DN25857_c0_g1_i2.p1  ORF type:complete len:112 (-),score=51.24 TRINITY_DN25857_c0_g1_i2:66-401(-)
MQRGLVGSEMCIRDRVSTQSTWDDWLFEILESKGRPTPNAQHFTRSPFGAVPAPVLQPPPKEKVSKSTIAPKIENQEEKIPPPIRDPFMKTPGANASPKKKKKKKKKKKNY